MAYEEIGNVKLVTLGGYNKKTRIDNPTTLEGYYLRSEGRADNFNKGKFKNLYVFRTEEGDVGVIAPAALDSRMKGATLGRMTLVQFTGEEDTGKGNPVKLFKVSQDKTNTLDAESLAEASITHQEDTSEESYPDEDPTEEAAPPVQTKSTRAASPTSAAAKSVNDMLAARAAARK